MPNCSRAAWRWATGNGNAGERGHPHSRPDRGGAKAPGPAPATRRCGWTASRGRERAAQTNLNVEVNAWPIQHEGGPGGRRLARTLRGNADASDGSSAEERDATRAGLDVRITDGQLVGGDPHRPWTVTAGQVRVRGAQQEILSLSAHQGAGQLELSGLLPQTGTPAAFSLRLHATAPRPKNYSHSSAGQLAATRRELRPARSSGRNRRAARGRRRPRSARRWPK